MYLEYPSEVVTRRKPKYLAERDAVLFETELFKVLPAVSATEKSGLLLFPAGQVFKGLNPEVTQFSTRPGIKGFFKFYLKSLISLLGLRSFKKIEFAYYVTNSYSTNFFHWFLDVLQKLEFIERNYQDLIEEAVVIIPSDHRADFMVSSLSIFGLRFFHPNNDQLLLVENLMVVPDLAPTGNYRKEIVLNLRKKLRNKFLGELDERISQEKRVYITRRNAGKRKIVNEDELLPKLREYGFKVVDMDALEFKSQVEVMLGVEILVSLHGAGLTHMLWMREAGKVLEIRASGDCHNNCYFTLASDLELEYYYTLAEKTDITCCTQQADCIIDPIQFEARLKRIVE